MKHLKRPRISLRGVIFVMFLSAIRRRFSPAAHDCDPSPEQNSFSFSSAPKIVLCAPLRLDQTENVVALLQSGCSVLLNLEQDSYEVARRLLDFVAGVAYHNENQIQRVAPRAFLITPCDAEVISLCDAV